MSESPHINDVNKLRESLALLVEYYDDGLEDVSIEDLWFTDQDPSTTTVARYVSDKNALETAIATTQRLNLVEDALAYLLSSLKNDRRRRKLDRNVKAACRQIGMAKLPAELLAQVFRETFYETPQGTDHIAFSHVCRRFREVSLHTYEPWSYVWPLMNRKWLGECLRRSGDHGLTVHLDVDRTAIYYLDDHKKGIEFAFMREVVAHCYRWTAVSWNTEFMILPDYESARGRAFRSISRWAFPEDSPEPDEEQTPQEAFSKLDLPRLRCLEIRRSETLYVEETDSQNKAAYIYSTWNTPALRHLRISACRIPMVRYSSTLEKSPPPFTLNKLSLKLSSKDFNDSKNESNGMLGYFLRLMSAPAMAALEELTVDFEERLDVRKLSPGRKEEEEKETAIERTVLPNVWNLDISVRSGDHLYEFFQHIDFPKLSHVTVTCEHEHSEHIRCQLKGIERWQQLIRETEHYCESLELMTYYIVDGLYDSDTAEERGCQWSADNFLEDACYLTEDIESSEKRDELRECALKIKAIPGYYIELWDRLHVLSLST